MHIVESLVIIDFSFVKKTSQMSLTHKIRDIPNSQNTFKIQFLLKILIHMHKLLILNANTKIYRYLPVHSWKCGDSIKTSFFNKKKMVLADVPSCLEFPYYTTHYTDLLCTVMDSNIQWCTFIHLIKIYYTNTNT